MVENPIKKNEIVRSFLVTSMYTVPVGWPHCTVVACEIIYTDEDDNEKVLHEVYRNDSQHAEENLIGYLKEDPSVNSSKKIKIRVYQNYSPCSDCAQEIMKYMREERGKENREVEMTISFANFYKTHAYTGNTQEMADANIKGLIVLYEQPDVKFKLLGVHAKWKRFLDMSEFFRLTEDEKNECLDEAESPRRKMREVQDQVVWYAIFWEAEITSKLDKTGIIQLHNELRMERNRLGN